MLPLTPATPLDRAWQLVLWTGFRVARLWWRLTQRPHEGALVAVHVGSDLLLVRTSYRRAWSFPGGGLKAGEAPMEAARRELQEEIGLAGNLAGPAGVFTGFYDGRPDRVHVYQLQLDRLPPLRLDHREIAEARLFGAAELDRLAVIGPVAAYLGTSRGAMVQGGPGDRDRG